MPRRVPTALEKLNALEAKKQTILQQRKEELLAIIEDCNALTIDDHLLASFLKLAINPNNKDHHILKELQEFTKFRKRSKN